MFAKGIIDPTKVVRSALQDAASIAGLLITTEAMIADKPDDKDRWSCYASNGWRYGWYGWYGWNGNVIFHSTPMNLKKAANFAAFFFAINKQAVDFKINPSFKTLKLLSSNVFPVEVISVIISDDPING